MKFVLWFTTMYSISKVAQIIHAHTTVLVSGDDPIEELVFDTRKIVDPTKSLFFALQGDRDGHDFVTAAIQAGIRNFVISKSVDILEREEGCQVLYVENVWDALQQLAAYHRRRFTFPVIGITGSNGKTVVKEWLYEMLLEEMDVYQSPKSYNSQLGVALSLWNLHEGVELAIIEAGISRPDEMEKLQKMIQPTIGVLTSIGVTHAEGFVTKQQKIREKAKLFTSADMVIYPSKYADIPLLDKEVSKTFRWGTHPDDDLIVEAVSKKELHSEVAVRLHDRREVISIPFVDDASIENTLTCAAVLSYLGISWERIGEKVQGLRPIEMRLQLKSGIRHCSVIDDTYSNDLGSLRIALDFLARQEQHQRKTLILSRMTGLSGNEKFDVKLIGQLINTKISRLIWVGEPLAGMEGLPFEVISYSTGQALLDALDTLIFYDETILVKGSRHYQLEHVVQYLTAQTHGTVLEVDLHALQRNLKAYRSRLPDGVKLMAMVKAFSYGSGSFEVANVLQYQGVDYLTVAFADEGVELRKGGISLPIMVLSPDESTFETLIKYSLEPEIYSFRIFKAFSAFVRQKGLSDYPIHVKLDTGMHRLGFLPAETEQLIADLRTARVLRVRSVLSHLVAAGDRAYDVFTLQQIALFSKFTAKLEHALGYSFIRHLANTSAIVDWPDAHFDMVRLGIGLYGVNLHEQALDLLQVHTLKTTVTQVKSLEAGDTVGYDRAGRLDKDGKVVTVKIGYADGYDRRFGNGVGLMQINGRLVPTIGNICMDMCMLYVDDLAVREGDEVIVFPDLIAAARAIDTIPYELLVKISPRVKRIYYYE